MKTRKCTQCGAEKEVSDNNFYKRIDAKDGYNRRCKTCMEERKRNWKSSTPEKQREYTKRAQARAKEIDPEYQGKYRKKRIREVKTQVFNGYGNKCACPGCDVTAFEFLSLDHVDGGGCRDRKQHKSTSYKTINVYQSVIDQGFPSTFQILCYNCHLAKDFYGKCPHENGVVREYKR